MWPSCIFPLLEEHVDVVARPHAHLAVGVGELAHIDDALGLVADVDHHIVAAQRHHATAHDLALGHGHPHLALLEKTRELVGGPPGSPGHSSSPRGSRRVTTSSALRSGADGPGHGLGSDVMGVR